MSQPLSGISSMATRQVLAELADAYRLRAGQQVVFESVGGVDATKRVAAGEAFDVVVLASDAIAKLTASGHIAAGSQVNLVHSGVSVAVRAGAPLPDVSSEAAVRAAVLAAPRISYSTGPSGVALAQLFERWGIADEIKARTVVPPPGVPVGSLVAKGEVALGFQQLSEMMGVPGITVLGALPDAVQITTTFSGAVATTSGQAEAVRAMLAFWASAACAQTKVRHGMVAA